MNKNILLVFLSLFLFQACASPQFIRKDNYYFHDLSLMSLVDDRRMEAYEHHPIFFESEVFKEGTPDYHQDVNYYLYGLLPFEKTIRLSTACGDKPFRQAYIDHTFGQSIVSIVTLGLFVPRTAKVWCGNVKKNI